ncbi:MAG: PBP1A family penicillin-binding protein [Candidatus Shapirobacteria bacterium]|jgi:1A family penicillin-binding protein
MKVIIRFLIDIGRPILELFKLLEKKIKKIKILRFKFKFKLPVFKIQKIKFKKKEKKEEKSRAIMSSKVNTSPVIEEKNKFKFGWKYPALFLVTILITGVLWWGYQVIIRNLPNVNEIYNPPKLSTKIYDRNGKLLYRFYDDEDRSWINFSEIPQSLVSATIAVEDKEFYQHHGFSIKGILEAIIYNFKKSDGDKLRGGSTITQQLVKNVFLDGEKSWPRKFKEAILAIMLERKLSKNEILERYFNQVPYGGDIYGVAEAANRYFGKKVSDLNLAESAFLAALPAAPSSYSPFTVQGYNLAKNRQEYVLNEMVSSGSIDRNGAEAAKKVEIKILEDKREILAPHFVFYVKNYLESLGFSNVERLGLSVKTSLDLNTQQSLEKITKEEIDKAKNLRISNGAAMVLDVKTGDILAMVGSKDYFAKDIDGKFNVVTQGLRQPGSSIKPINYLLALEQGRNLRETIEDSPITYQIPGQKAYSPVDYTGKYLGTVTLRTALASSLNIPSVKLLNEDGINNMIDLAQKMGISTWDDRSRFGLSLALGAGEVKMIDLAGAYSIFANLGEKVKVNPILEVDNYLGEKVYQKQVESEKILDQKNTFLINSALSDNEARSPVFGTNSLLNISGKTVAVKTGTTNNLKDNWCIGWTPSYLVAVWVGNNDSSPMSWVASGISGATPIWNRMMKELLKNKTNEKWPTPDGLYQSEVCGKKDWFSDGSEKKIVCPSVSPEPSPTI